MKSFRESSDFAVDIRAGLPGPQAAANTVRRMPSAPPQDVFFHLDFARSLQMHRKLAVSIFVTALVLSLGYMAKRWNTYKAQALVYVQPSPHKVIENGPGQQWPYDANTYESYIQQQVHDVTRPDVLAAAVKRIPGWQRPRESEQAAADRLGTAVEVTRLGTAYEVQIESTGSSAQDAAQLANAVASSYIDSATREQRAGDPQRIELLREERDRILKELAADRSEQEDLSRKLGVAAASGAAADPIDEQIAQTRVELVKARTANDEAAAKLTALSGGKASSAAINAEADELVAADPGLVSMKTALNKRRSDLISQMANLTPSHPQFKQHAEELAKINASLETMSSELRVKAAAQIQQKLKNDLERTSSVEARLNGQLAQLTGAAGTAAPRMQRLNELGADVQRLQNRFAVVDEQYRNLTIENNSPGAVYLASAALPPLHSARGKVLRNALILIVAGLVLAIGAALVAHNFDPRVYIAQDVERVLGFAPMAQLPDLQEVGSGVAEEYMLRVAAAVEHAHQQGLLTSCIFTGVAAGDGATTLSKRVSNMLEAMGRETILVDAAGTPQDRLAAAASNPVADLVHAPRGTRSSALLQQMHDEADEDSVVITDTAPLLVSGETEYMARFVDSAIVVLQSGVTTKAQLREVAQILQKLEVSSVGFVLNRISLKNANPAFVQSVRAVQTHLQAQARPSDLAPQRPAIQREPKSEPIATPAALNLERLWNLVAEQPEPIQAPVEVPTQAASAPVYKAPAAAVANPVIAASQPFTSAPAQPAAIPAPIPAAAPVPQTLPTSVAEPAGQSVAVSQHVPTPVSLPERSPAPEWVSRPLRGREPAPSAMQPAQSRPAAAPSAPAAVLQTPLPEPVRPRLEEHAVPSPVAQQPALAVSQDPQPTDPEAPSNAASRLGGLRNLMTSLGIKNLHKEAELRKAHSEAETVTRPAERSIYPQTERAAVPARADAHTSLQEVKAQPEIIPPQAAAELAEREAANRPAKSPRVSRWDMLDDVETLPSRRGQYRNRR